MSVLHTLVPAGKKRKRIGRGGSRGGTAGFGHKGQKARSGPHIRPSFEGGQMPLTRRLPKRGFSNAPFKVSYEIVNLKTLNNFFEEGATITMEALREKGIVKGPVKLLKILGEGTLEKHFVVHADKFSKTAESAIINKGGRVHLNKEK
ncbi:50S ribosomal protein L15 [Candidatus Dependentiae bacterium]|nr:50S ribosomal protein L15 [Candidatus Dependentiae bacterium]